MHKSEHSSEFHEPVTLARQCMRAGCEKMRQSSKHAVIPLEVVHMCDCMRAFVDAPHPLLRARVWRGKSVITLRWVDACASASLRTPSPSVHACACAYVRAHSFLPLDLCLRLCPCLSLCVQMCAYLCIEGAEDLMIRPTLNSPHDVPYDEHGEEEGAEEVDEVRRDHKLPGNEIEVDLHIIRPRDDDEAAHIAV